MLALAEMTSGRVFVGPPRELSRLGFVKYAGASGDFNPLHVDEVSARAAGQPSVFGHGMYSAGLLATAIADLVGLRNLRRYQVRFTRLAWPGEIVHAELTVAGVEKSEDKVRVSLDCVLTSEAGAIVSGSAIAEYGK